MASVNFMKCKSVGEIKAMMRHSATEERLKHEHSNKDIDKSETYKNVNYTKADYKKSCERFDKRIKTLDETTNTNKRKDRVVAFSLEVPCCDGMTDEESKYFFRDVCGIIAKKYGIQNVIGAYAHYDEKHQYIDHGELKTSREHLHCFVVPEHDGKLNGKWFSNKKNMIELNKSIDELAREKYKKSFLTGKEARKRSVEELKSLSNEEQEKLVQDRDRLQEEIKRIDLEKEETKNALDKTKEELDQLDREKQLKKEAYNRFDPEALNYPQTKEKKSVFGKKTIEIDSVAYEDFISKVQDMEEVVVEAKEDQAELKAQIRRADRAEHEIREVTHDRDEVQKCAELVAKENEHLRSSLSKIKNYAKDQQDRNLESFVKRVLAFDIVKAVEKAKTVTKTISRSSRDDDYER